MINDYIRQYRQMDYDHTAFALNISTQVYTHYSFPLMNFYYDLQVWNLYNKDDEYL